MARATDIGSLITSLALDDTQFHRDIGRAERGVRGYAATTNRYLAQSEQAWRSMTGGIKSMGAAVVSVAGVTGLGYLIKQTLNTTAELKRNANMAGILQKHIKSLLMLLHNIRSPKKQ